MKTKLKITLDAKVTLARLAHAKQGVLQVRHEPCSVRVVIFVVVAVVSAATSAAAAVSVAHGRPACHGFHADRAGWVRSTQHDRLDRFTVVRLGASQTHKITAITCILQVLINCKRH